MDGGLKLGTVWGIPIRLHASWLVVFALLTWSLAAGYFPADYPGWPPAAYWAVGAGTALLFFGSVLAHELAHAWVAQRRGIPTRGIVLFVFGGVAQIDREPSVPAVELQIAVAGPLTSLALAGIFGAARWVIEEYAMLAAPAAWLLRMNLMLAVFNILPGFPLDGGRILRAVLWRRTGSAFSATRIAARVGQALGFGVVVLGFLTMLGGNVLGGLWMSLVGWFLQNAAAATGAQSNLQELLRGVTVGQAMTLECPRVQRGLSLDRLVEDEVLGRGRRCFVVAHDGQLEGLLTLHEVKAVPRQRWAKLTVGEVMTPAARLTTVTPQEDLLGALQKMDNAGVAQMPVVSGDALVGMLGREQVLHYVRVRAELWA